MTGLPGTGGGGLGRRLAERLYGSPLYRPFLTGPPPKGLALALPDPWPGDPNEANRLFQGRYQFAGEDVGGPGTSPWEVAAPSEIWAAEAHGFAWLRHFRAAGGEAAQRQARALLAAWIARHDVWHPLIWRPDVLGRRLMSWLAHADFVLGDEDPLRPVFLTSLARQARHLRHAVRLAPAGAPRFAAAAGLCCAALGLQEWRRHWPRTAARVNAELTRQILPDGGHFARNPSLHMAVLRDLIVLRAAVHTASEILPETWQHAIDRMAPMLRFFQYGDGGLALFHGSKAESSGTVETTLRHAQAPGKPLSSAPQSRFERAAAEQSVLIADVGLPPAGETGGTPHAGMLAFEFGCGNDRLIVNCGTNRRPGSEWAQALASTAAHSTLTLANADAVQPGAQPKLAQPVLERREGDGSTWLTASHEGYLHRYGLAHRRQIYLGASGEDLRGEDRLQPAHAVSPSVQRLPFAVRFHLHPHVKASLLQNRQAVLLKTAGGHGWRFLASGGELAIEDSVYCGEDGASRHSLQIVVSGETAGNGAQVKWALARISAR